MIKIFRHFVLLSLLSLAAPLGAVKLRDGRTYFDASPRLISAETTFEEIRFSSPTYFYTVEVPDRAGEPLQTIVIQQEEGLDAINYNLQDITARVGDQNVPLQAVLIDSARRGLKITFPEPIGAGKQVTLVIKPHRNPDFAGVYQFRVTAFPAGELPQGQFLGYGRFHFRDSGFSSSRFLRH